MPLKLIEIGMELSGEVMLIILEVIQAYIPILQLKTWQIMWQVLNMSIN